MLIFVSGHNLCDLTWILTNLDRLWFKRTQDILWFKAAKSVHLGLTCSHTAEVKQAASTNVLASYCGHLTFLAQKWLFYYKLSALTHI
jgi:hypothetical protein